MSHEATMAANPASFARVREVAESLTNAADQSADFDSLVRQQARFVFKVAYGVLRNSHDAEDVAQETFLRAQRASMNAVRDPQSWLATIAFRIAIDRKRKLPELDLANYEIAANKPDAEHLAIQQQQVVRLQRLIASLPEDLRYPLVLSAIEELNSRQIAEVLDIPESSVRGRTMRARQLLKEKLSAQMEAKPRVETKR
ncbi:MAG TPA: RNA polymerase sigma factor [Candidatus Angelobacter sp.]|nr:RNA polymerase sigma factor [Candidatus Angelobacter sp.]